MAFVWKIPCLWMALVAGLAGAWAFVEPQPIVAYLLAYLAAAASTLLGADAAARAPLPKAVLATVVVTGVLGVTLLLRVQELPPLAFALVHGALLLLAGAAVGARLGREVVDPAHVWPLLIVGSAADLWSVAAPAGITRAVLEGHGPVSLSAVVLQLPVGGDEIAPVLGIGDIVFTAFLAAAAARLDLPRVRALIGLAVGFGLCLGGLLLLEVPVPALPFVALAFGAAQGRAVRPRGRELLAALGVALGVLVLGLGWLAGT